VIKLDRGPAPRQFHSPHFKKYADEARHFFSQPRSIRAQRRFDFTRITSKFFPEIRRHLQEQFWSKCAYCESRVERVDVENFRPKTRATNLDRRVDDDCYWWLVFEWTNYLPACRQCNTMKGSRFPIKGRRAEPEDVGPALDAERPLLLDPCADDPTEVLIFLGDGRVTSEDERGKVTIDVLDLNRSTLVEARHRELRILEGQLLLAEDEQFSTSALNNLKTMTTDQEPFAAMKRQLVKTWAADQIKRDGSLGWALSAFVSHRSVLDGIRDPSARSADFLLAAAAHLDERIQQRDTYSVDADTLSEDFYRNAHFIEKVELTNIRAIKQLTLHPEFGDNGAGSWLMLLGENGAGKSTVLQAIACALIGQQGVDSLGLKASAFLRRGCTRGQVRVEVTGLSTPITLTLKRGSDRITIDPPEPKLMVLGYGATRVMAGSAQPEDGRRHFKVRNLFDPYARLSDGKPWLHQASRAEFNRHVRSLSTLLPQHDTATFSRRGGEIYVDSPGSRSSLNALSSGYQAVLALALDVMSVMRNVWDDMDSAEGVVLIDEVDAHLHPRWKMKIVPLLRQLFPRVQFIATSHEPLTLRSLDATEVTVLRRAADGEVFAVNARDAELTSPRYLRVDQLLTSELFGLHSTDDPDVEAMFEEYYGLLAKHAPGRDDKKKIAQLKDDLADKRQMGTTQRERIVFEAADEFLARRQAEKEAQSLETRAAARRTLQALWADLNGNGDRTAATPARAKRTRKGAA
jgi:uncharacterized protein (TIGR02646 family)